MRILPTLALVALCAGGVWSSEVRADDPPAPPEKPSDPKPGEPPKPPEPPAEPKPGDPPAPAPAEPPPQTPEEKAAAEEKARKEEELRKKQEEEEAKQAEADELERQKREEARKQAAIEEDRPPPPVAPRPGPPGTCYLPASDSPLAAPPGSTQLPGAEGDKDAPPAPAPGPGKGPAAGDKGKDAPSAPKGGGKDAAGGPPAKPAPPADDKPKGAEAPAPAKITGAIIGTKPEDLNRLMGTRGPETRRQFDFERPQHRRFVREAFLDCTEITNAQWHRFLQDYVTAYVCDGKYPTLVDVAGYLLKTAEPKNDDVGWRQLAEANKDALLKAMPNLLGAPGAVWPQPFKNAILPKRDLTLVFYSKQPPDDWQGMVPQQERLNHPVRHITALDLDAYAEWSGKHVQSEFEYEYAARGRDGLEYPWGKIWRPDWCNWGARVKNPKTQEADTWAVGSQPKGGSWIGAMDLMGNVAEWTSSDFTPYPGNKLTHEFFNVVRIIRGGTAVDQETLVLRPAARNFIGLGFNAAPPYPANRYAWVGGRCAWWPQAGANQAPFVERRATRGGRVKAPTFDPASGTYTGGDLNLERLAGTVAEDYDPDAKDNVWVKGRCKSVVLLPMRSVAEASEEKEKDPNAVNAVRVKAGKEGLYKESESDEPKVILAAFHTDAHLLKVGLRKKKAARPPPANEDERKAREKEDKEAAKQRGRNPFPELEEGTCAPGTYLLAVWHRKLCLVDSSREFICSLTAADKFPNLDYKKATAGQFPPCKIAVDDSVNLINGTVTLPAATGKGTDPLQWVVVSFSIEVQQEDVVSANGWR